MSSWFRMVEIKFLQLCKMFFFSDWSLLVFKSGYCFIDHNWSNRWVTLIFLYVMLYLLTSNWTVGVCLVFIVLKVLYLWNHCLDMTTSNSGSRLVLQTQKTIDRLPLWLTRTPPPTTLPLTPHGLIEWRSPTLQPVPRLVPSWTFQIMSLMKVCRNWTDVWWVSSQVIRCSTMLSILLLFKYGRIMALRV